MRSASFIKTVGWGVVMAGLYRAWCRLSAPLPDAPAAPIQTWEGEGGNVPAARPQPATDPNPSTGPAT